MSDWNNGRPEDDFDFSDMSLDDLLASVHADLGDLPAPEPKASPAAPQPQKAPAAPQPQPKPQPAPQPVRRPAPAPSVSPDQPTGGIPLVTPKKAKGKKAEKQTGEKKPGLSRLWIGVILGTVVLVLALVAGLLVYRSYNAAKERSLPETAVENLIQTAGEDYWLDGIRNAAVLRVTEFEDESAIVDKYLLSAVRGKELGYREFAGESTESLPVYLLAAGGTDFCRVELSVAPDRSAGFGLPLWQVSKVELLESFLSLETRTVLLNVKADSTVVLNGVEVSRDYMLPGSDGYVADYRIEGLYDDYTVEVLDAEGNPEEPVSVSGDSYSFPVPGKSEFTFYLSAPGDATVTVGDVTLGGESVVSTGGTYPVYDAVEEFLTLESLDPDTVSALTQALEKQPTVTVYRYSVYDYEKPSVTVTYADGSSVSGSEDGDSYAFPLHSNAKPDEEAAKRAEEFIRLYVNFSANVGSQPWFNLESLTPYLVKGSDLYTRIVNLADAMTLSDSGSATFNYLELGDFIRCGDILTTCRVSFGLSCADPDGTRECDNCYDLALVYVNGAWRVVGMIPVE